MREHTGLNFLCLWTNAWRDYYFIALYIEREQGGIILIEAWESFSDLSKCFKRIVIEITHETHINRWCHCYNCIKIMRDTLRRARDVTNHASLYCPKCSPILGKLPIIVHNLISKDVMLLYLPIYTFLLWISLGKNIIDAVVLTPRWSDSRERFIICIV